MQSRKRYVHDELGWNFRLSNLQAAVGRSRQLEASLVLEKLRVKVAHSPFAHDELARAAGAQKDRCLLGKIFGNRIQTRGR
jgi:dTDP-4-amino-4,6-dideoxygalactose transaminase